MEACPIDNTNRSRLGHTGSPGSKQRNCCHKQYATGAIAIGVPGCPELAACTASMERVRIVLILVRSMLSVAGEKGEIDTLLWTPLLPPCRAARRSRPSWPIQSVLVNCAALRDQDSPKARSQTGDQLDMWN